MTLPYPSFLVNFKVYDGTSAEDGVALAKTIEAVQEATAANFVVAPQTPDLRLVAENTSLPVVAQSVDAGGTGRGNGAILPETVRKAGADGVVVNHPESQATLAEMEETVQACTDCDLETIVCVDTLEKGRAVLSFDPDCLLFENPDDIATGNSLPESNPELVREFVAMVEETAPETRVLLGGGISERSDVERAFELGADAAGAASAAVQADDQRKWFESIASAFEVAD
ncbi:triose-phosphate isomerase [Halorussus halophilus]|uniref:triose-phosphate isomerase n=1 Tax=Halorussus halophilus TaxID=2650975 RepID=UPI0013014333|nr:triose-phosphate isomerase [Halorussus halophilus]